MSLGSYSLGSAALGGELSSSPSITYFSTSGAVGVALSVAGVTTQIIQNSSGQAAVAFSETATAQWIANSSGAVNVAFSETATAQWIANTVGAVNVALSISGSASAAEGSGFTFMDASGTVAVSFSLASVVVQRVTDTGGSEPYFDFVTSDGLGFNVTKPNEFDLGLAFSWGGVTIPLPSFHCPQIALPAKRTPRLHLEMPDCPAPSPSTVSLSLDGFLDDLTLSGSLLRGVLLSGSASLDDFLLSSTSSVSVALAVNVAIDDVVFDSELYKPTGVGNPAPDASLSNWDILRGSIDLCGLGPNGESNVNAPDIRPGNGMYLDLCGTTGDVDGILSAKLRTKSAFSFVSGSQYRLSFYYCGYIAASDHHFDVSVGDSGEIVAPTRFSVSGSSLFALGEVVWTQPSNASGKLIFDHDLDHPISPTGTLLDRVRLENLTSGTVLFYDYFDFENP